VDQVGAAKCKIDLKRKVLVWFDVCRKQVDGVKTLPTSAEVLMAPHLARPYKIWVDARDVKGRSVSTGV